jgi:hypothetical protein
MYKRTRMHTHTHTNCSESTLYPTCESLEVEVYIVLYPPPYM